MKVTELPVESIRTDGGTQARAEIDNDKVDEYRQAMEEGSDFPPVVVYHDGSDHWLADGFHRFFAGKRAGFKKLKCDVRQGTKRDAILFAVGCNGTHGLPRTNADKHKAVLMLLEDEKWRAWTNVQIAKACCVSDMTVKRIRDESHPQCGSERKYIDKHGNESTMNTANIGKGLRVLASEIGEDDEPDAPKSSKQYINGETGEEIENLVTVTTKETRTGRGIQFAHDAINVLKSIPMKDPLRVDGLEIVERWIRDNK
jgi:hypothetical protein